MFFPSFHPPSSRGQMLPQPLWTLLTFGAMALISSGGPLVTVSRASAYYVDAEGGNDAYDGRSIDRPFRTLAKLQTTALEPGDVVQLKAGCRWREQLNLAWSGTPTRPIKLIAYGTAIGAPIISGADAVSGISAVNPDQSRHAADWSREPKQVFFDGVRGTKKSTTVDLVADGDWCYADKKLNFFHRHPVAVEVTARPYAVDLSGSNLVVAGIQLERTESAAVRVGRTCEGVTLAGLTILQWSDAIDQSIGGVTNAGSNTTIGWSSFGRDNGADLADQNWAGFVAIVSTGASARIIGNRIFHNSTENETGMGRFAYGIKIGSGSTGRTEVAENLIHHVGSNGILVIDLAAQGGDRILIHDNEIRQAGQAGISVYRTRVAVAQHASVEGRIYNNEVSFANRLGGSVGGGYVDTKNQGNRAAGIHFNDGSQGGVSAAAPFLRWFCHDNEVHHSCSPAERASPDSDGVALDYNANGVQVFRNRIHDCDGKGIYIWNADDCRIYSNLVYGNDAGILVTSSAAATVGGEESSNGNLVYNNTFFKNYNGIGVGKDYHTEIYFGLRGQRNTFTNNILYAYSDSASVRYAYYYSPTGSADCITDGNLLFSEAGGDARICYDAGLSGPKSFAAWKVDRPGWDGHSLQGDPLFTQAAAGDFDLQRFSPARDRGVQVGPASDFRGAPVDDAPDIGAFEGQPESAPAAAGTPRIVPTAPGSARMAQQSVKLGKSVMLCARPAGAGPFSYQWQQNGAAIPNAIDSALLLTDTRPADAGVYTVTISDGTGASEIAGVVLGIAISGKLAGAGEEVGTDVRHPNGNIYDQILLTGSALTVRADAGQVVRASYVDLNNDIVQVEFAGSGSVTISLAAASGPAGPVNYRQGVSYMKGHATITIADADETSNVSIFSVGRLTAFDPTGVYDFTKPVSATNDPARSGSPLFIPEIVYDGVADFALLAVISRDGRFGGVRCADAQCFATAGLTGIFMPDIDVLGPVNLHNVSAAGVATPVLVTGSVGAVVVPGGGIAIAGGDMLQANGRPVQVGACRRIAMSAGVTSDNRPLPRTANLGTYTRSGVDVTLLVAGEP